MRWVTLRICICNAGVCRKRWFAMSKPGIGQAALTGAMGPVFLEKREGNLSRSLRRAVLAQAWFVESTRRPAISKTVGTTGSGKNKIARPKRLHPPASRPQIRTLGPIIYLDDVTISVVCFSSLNLSPEPHKIREPRTKTRAFEFQSGTRPCRSELLRPEGPDID